MLATPPATPLRHAEADLVRKLLAFIAQADSTEAEFRGIYKELVETNTTLSAGSCTLAAERMASRLKAAGFPDSDLHIVVEPSHPKEGSLVAILPGSDSKAKAILLLAHIDVVPAGDGWTIARLAP